MKKFMIIDGSSIFYRAFFAMPALTAPTGEPTGAVTGVANIILKLLREYSPDYAAVALDVSRKTFRTEIFPEYKATRSDTPDELAAQYPIFYEFIGALGIKILTAPNYEADDIIGTLAAQAENFSVDIVTGDRDALQLINDNTRVLMTKNTKIDIYDEETFQAEYNFPPKSLVDFKGLSGDTSDNIPGVKGIGVKTATKLLNEYGTLENILANADKISSKKFREALTSSAEIAVLSKKLAQINCEVPNIIFDAESFKFTPNIALADKVCDRYGLKVAKKKIHDLFDTIEDLFSYTPPENFLEVGKICAEVDVEKIFAAESLSVAIDEKSAVVKVEGGEIFSVDKDLLTKIFKDFPRKIIVNNFKKILKTNSQLPNRH